MIDSREFRNCCGHFATGITVVTTAVDGQAHGMTANGFMSVSIDPPLIVVSIGERSRMHQLLSQSMRYGVSLLAESGTIYSNHFAGRPDDTLEIPWIRQNGVPLLADALGHFVARVVDVHEAGDHALFIGEVEYLHYEGGRPLLYYAGGYNQLKADPKPQFHEWYDDEMFFFQSEGLDLSL
jgi:flavin reductase (DIM6/NTAB) family NADH-FMN oxidoreductase RutF